MTTKREYRCNLCHDIIMDNPQQGWDRQGVGVLFTDSQTMKPFRYTLCHEAENHICASCIAAIRRKPEETQSAAPCQSQEGK